MANLPATAEDVTDVVDVRSYGDLQARLRAMAYTEPVGVDTVPLVKRLLADVVHASDARGRLETELERTQREAVELSQLILPLRKENARLTRENNSLHLELIHQEESISERERACELQVDALRDQLTQLQFVNRQSAQALQEKEQEMARLHAQLERLMAVGGGGATSSSRPAAATGIVVRGPPLSPSPPNKRLSQSAGPAPAGDDHKRVLELREQIGELTSAATRHEETIRRLEEKLAHREQEIARLARLTVDRAATSSAAVAAAANKDDETAELQIEQLTGQVDILNNQVAKYEARLKSANDQLRRSSSLEHQLAAAERLNEQLHHELQTLKSKHALLESTMQPSDSSPPQDAGPSSSAELPEDNAEASDENSALREQVRALTMQKERLEDALRATQYDKVSFTNALSNANSHNRVLSSDLARSEAKEKEMSEDIERLQYTVTDLNARLDASQRELEVLRDTVKQAEEARTLESEKNKALHRELRSMDKVVLEREDECRQLHQTVAIQKREVEQLTAKWEGLRTAMDKKAASEESTDGSKRILHAQELRWLEEERQELRRGKEELTTRVLELEESLRNARLELQSLQLQRDDVMGQLALSKKREKGLDDLLDTKKDELQKSRTELVESKESLKKLRQELDNAQILVKRGEVLENEKIQFQNEALELKRIVEELRDQNTGIKVTAEHGEQHVKRLDSQIQQLQRDLTAAEKTKNSIEKQYLELQRSYESATTELRNARQLATHYQSEYDKVLHEWQTNQHARTSEQSALETSQAFVSDLKSQLRQAQSELTLKQAALHQAENRLDQERSQVKTLQAKLTLVQDELLQIKDRYRGLETTVKHVRDDTSAKDRQLTEKTAAVENLKLLIEQMESTRDQLMFKLKQEQQVRERGRQEMDEMQTRLDAAESKHRECQNEVASLKRLTRTLDAEKDQSLDQLDVLTEKYHEMSELNTKLQSELAQAETNSRDFQSRLMALSDQLSEADARAHELEAAVVRLESDVDGLQHMKAMNEAEMKALRQDLENMTVENQALSEECTRLQYASQRGDQSVTTLTSRIRDAEKARDILNVELEDLQLAYRALIQEHEGVQKVHAEAVAHADEVMQVNESLRAQATKASNELEIAKQKNATLTTEAAAYRDQITFLTEKLRANDELLVEVDHEQERLKSELAAQKEVAQEISAQRFGAQAQNASVSQRLVHLEARLSTAQLETRTLRDKLQAESNQRRNLEDVVVSLRQKIASHQATIEHLEEQREAMANEIRATHQRLVAGDAMDVSELHPTPPSMSRRSEESNAQRADTGRGNASPLLSDTGRSRATRTTTNNSPDNGSSSSSILPIRALEMAQLKCQELEDRLAQQDEMIKQMERSRSKFKRFAAKYEREIESRDKLIEELRTSQTYEQSRRSSSSHSSSASQGSNSSVASLGDRR